MLAVRCPGKEIAFNAVGIPHTDLDVIPRLKSGIRIQFLALEKQTSHGINATFMLIIHFMQQLNHSTIEIT